MDGWMDVLPQPPLGPILDAQHDFGGQHLKPSGTVCKRQLPSQAQQHGLTSGSLVPSSSEC